MQGHLFIISAPSGAGKTTICKAVRKRFRDLFYSISFTTRKPRHGEKDGIDYHFISLAQFQTMIDEGKWAEWAMVHGNYYGTSAELINQGLAAGRDILLDIDTRGAMQIRAKYPDSITIFIMPPSLDVLRTRLESRGTDSPAAIAKRLAAAEQEIRQKDLYKYVVVNDRLKIALARMYGIIENHCRVK